MHTLTDGVTASDDREVVTLTLTVEIPYVYARPFAEAMTGNDDDVILAAERGIRDRLADAKLVLPYGDTYIGGEEVEVSFDFDEDDVREALRHVRAL